MILHGLGGSLAENLVVLQVRKQRRGRRLAREQGEDDEQADRTVEVAMTRKRRRRGGRRRTASVELTLPYLPVGSTSTYPGSSAKRPPPPPSPPLLCTCRAPIILLFPTPPNHTRATEQEAALPLPQAPHRPPAFIAAPNQHPSQEIFSLVPYGRGDQSCRRGIRCGISRARREGFISVEAPPPLSPGLNVSAGQECQRAISNGDEDERKILAGQPVGRAVHGVESRSFRDTCERTRISPSMGSAMVYFSESRE